MQLCRSCALKSDAKNRAGVGGKRGSRSRPFHFRLACLIGHFRVPPGLCFKARVGAQPLIWKSFFILMQITLIFTRKVVHLIVASFWKLGFLELGSGLFLRRPHGLKSWHRLLRPSLLSLSCICHDLLSLWTHYPNLASKLAPQMPKRY